MNCLVDLFVCENLRESPLILGKENSVVYGTSNNLFDIESFHAAVFEDVDIRVNVKTSKKEFVRIWMFFERFIWRRVVGMH